MLNIPGSNSTTLPSADLDIRSIKYLNLFKQYMELAEAHNHPASYMKTTSEYEMTLCHAVYNAYVELEREDGPHYGKEAPKKVLMSTAMKKCRGSLNPGDVSIMIDSVYDFYYGDT